MPSTDRDSIVLGQNFDNGLPQRSCSSKRLNTCYARNLFNHMEALPFMRKRLRFFVLPLMLAALAAKALSLADHFDGKTWWNHVKVLADDNMEGRETGSEGLRKAEVYIADQLQKAGLQPAGSKAPGAGTSFYQPVKFESRQIVEKDSSIVLVRDDKVEPL